MNVGLLTERTEWKAGGKANLKRIEEENGRMEEEILRNRAQLANERIIIDANIQEEFVFFLKRPGVN